MGIISSNLIPSDYGEMAEWLIALVLKTRILEMVS